MHGSREVAKVVILVDDSGADVLLSRKCAPGRIKHNLLEMLGGGLDPGEGPLEALVRELGEEETTGTLARAAARAGRPQVLMVADEKHYLFEMSIDAAVVPRLRPDPKESLGFRRVPRSELEHPAAEKFTPKTCGIRAAMRTQGVSWSWESGAG